MNIKKLFEKTSTGFKEFVAKVEFANVVGLSEELDKYIKKGTTNTTLILDNGERTDNISLPNNSGRLLVDTKNEANVDFANSDESKKLTVGYNGIKYYNKTDTLDTSDLFFYVDETGCYANVFEASSVRQKISTSATVAAGTVTVSYNANSLGSDVNAKLNYGNLTITSTQTSNIWDEEQTTTNKITYSINNIKRNDFTYTFPDKSGTIELVDEEKDAKLKHIELVEGFHNNYVAFYTFGNGEEFVNYVKSDKSGVDYYDIIIDDSIISAISLNNSGYYNQSVIKDNAILLYNGKYDFDTDNSAIYKVYGISEDATILPDSIIIVNYDNNKQYKLNIDKCVELGILTEEDIATQTSRLKTNVFNKFNAKIVK